MPHAVTGVPGAGFVGKLPARGDFVSRGLRRGFTDPWDAWLAEVIPGSRAVLREAWQPAFLEAPVWRFALPPGQCGAEAAAGVLLPSIDGAGRLWPLTLAASFPERSDAPSPAEDWFDALEEAGRQAVQADVPPEALAALLDAAPSPAAGAGGRLAAWSTAGSPRVAPRAFEAGALPGPAAFARMLDDTAP